MRYFIETMTYIAIKYWSALGIASGLVKSALFMCYICLSRNTLRISSIDKMSSPTGLSDMKHSFAISSRSVILLPRLPYVAVISWILVCQLHISELRKNVASVICCWSLPFKMALDGRGAESLAWTLENLKRVGDLISSRWCAVGLYPHRILCY